VGRNVDLDPKSVEVPRMRPGLARDRLQRQAELGRHRLPHARAARYLLGEPSTHDHEKRYERPNNLQGDPQTRPSVTMI
jgi:hypothetical protein